MFYLQKKNIFPTETWLYLIIASNCNTHNLKFKNLKTLKVQLLSFMNIR